MTEKTWETLKVQYCQHVDEKVGLQAQVVYPPDMMPDQPARILAHRCSHGLPATWMDARAASGLARTQPSTRLKNKNRSLMIWAQGIARRSADYIRSYM